MRWKKRKKNGGREEGNTEEREGGWMVERKRGKGRGSGK